MVRQTFYCECRKCYARRFYTRVLYRVPLYYEAKIAFILWLTLPRFRGATWLYERVVAKYLETYEADIDQKLETLQKTAGERINTITRQGSYHIREKSGQILSMVATFVAQAGQHAAAESGSMGSPPLSGTSAVSGSQQENEVPDTRQQEGKEGEITSPKSPRIARLEGRVRHRKEKSSFGSE